MVKEAGVSVRMNKSFFEDIFEPARRELEKQVGVKVGQLDFTEFLAKKKIRFKLPKQKMNLKSNLKIKRKFMVI